MRNLFLSTVSSLQKFISTYIIYTYICILLLLWQSKTVFTKKRSETLSSRSTMKS